MNSSDVKPKKENGRTTQVFDERASTKTTQFFLAILLLAIVTALSTPTFAQSQRRVPAPPEVSGGALGAMDLERNAALLSASNGNIQIGTIPRSIISAPLAYPALGASIEGINFNENTTLTGFFQIPPDPIGVPGPNHVLAVTNTSIRWWTKAGTLQTSQSLKNFFTSLAPLTTTFDPKVIYDQNAGRFVVVTLERTDTINGAPSNTSRIFVAVSDDSDPNGTWYFFQINSNVTISGFARWADFPGLAVDNNVIYITANMFRFGASQTFGGVRLWIIPKTPFFSGGAATVNIFDPIGLANANPSGEGAVATVSQPTQMYGTVPGTLGTYLMQYGGLNDGVNAFLGAIQIDNPTSPTPVFTGHFIDLGPFIAFDNLAFALPGAPQMGSTRLIATNDRRVSNTPVWRNNSLWVTAPIRSTASPDASQVTARWWKLNATDPNAIVLSDTGNVGAEDVGVGTFTFFPTVTVDKFENMAIGFAASGPNIFPGAYFAGRLANDPPGTVRATGTLRAGLDFYVRTFANSATAQSRWGDYSGIGLDPADETTLWAYNEYALTRGTTGVGSGLAALEDGRWGTAFGSFVLACTLTCPPNQTKSNDPGQCGAVATFAGPTTTGNCGTVSCSPGSGSFFPVGTTTVTCKSNNGAGPEMCTFTVTVNDTQPPTITCPANQTAVTNQNACPSASCLVVNYPAPVALDNCPSVLVVCNPPGGSCFPVGVTTVTCTATDTSGNTATCSFTVTTFDVAVQDDSDPSIILLWNSITGQYRFCCKGTTYTGVGTATRKGCIYTLQTPTAKDRRVLGKHDKAVHAGSGSLQKPPGQTQCTITDRNTLNDTLLPACQ